ncbi:hypothetical protein ACHAW5_005156 [Stephanodiscus triporus]|uniref:Sepiapterin reductase n=1 Tax=Stephanodiscus triporus TaxID=2934178 RepID=A0ABD3MYN8_9STRA
MSNQWAVITGGSSGIGAALFRRLVQREPSINCLAVGRRLAQLEAVRREAIGSCVEAECRAHIVRADVSTPEGIATVAGALPKDARVIFLVHNAGVLGPIAPLSEIDRSAWRDAISTNLEAPLFLTQALVPRMMGRRPSDDDDHGARRARILHVSSGAAHHPYVGWGPYCVTKAGLHMMYRCLSEELYRQHDILVGSVRPGVVDTPMQAEIRGYDGDPESFPMKAKFDALHAESLLERPEDAAAFFHWLLSEVGDEEFRAEEWDFRDCKVDSRWRKFSSA